MRKWARENPEKKAVLDRRYYLKNKEKRMAYIKNFKQEHVDLYKSYAAKSRLNRKDAWRGYRYKHKYGITLDDYNRMFKEQKGRCAVCNIHQAEIKRIFVIDHDHKTDKVRALTCQRCNLALGYLEDKELCMKATLFLQRFE